jgi:hypothetical protein
MAEYSTKGNRTTVKYKTVKGEPTGSIGTIKKGKTPGGRDYTTHRIETGFGKAAQHTLIDAGQNTKFSKLTQTDGKSSKSLIRVGKRNPGLKGSVPISRGPIKAKGVKK